MDRVCTECGHVVHKSFSGVIAVTGEETDCGRNGCETEGWHDHCDPLTPCRFHRDGSTCVVEPVAVS